MEGGPQGHFLLGGEDHHQGGNSMLNAIRDSNSREGKGSVPYERASFTVPFFWRIETILNSI